MYIYIIHTHTHTNDYHCKQKRRWHHLTQLRRFKPWPRYASKRYIKTIIFKHLRYNTTFCQKFPVDIEHGNTQFITCTTSLHVSYHTRNNLNFFFLSKMSAQICLHAQTASPLTTSVTETGQPSISSIIILSIPSHPTAGNKRPNHCLKGEREKGKRKRKEQMRREGCEND